MMSVIGRKLALAAAVAAALLLGGCGGGSSCAESPASVACQPPPPTPPPTSVASPTPTPSALDVSGRWRSQARSWNLRLEQRGTSLTGVVMGFKNVSYPDPTDPLVQITGSIGAGGEVSFQAPVFAIEFSGTAEPNGLRMTGTLRDCAGGCRNYGEVLDKQ